MRTLREKYMAEIEIGENVYKADFNILEKYQGFSSEILRLSLLTLAVYGFIITNMVFKLQGETSRMLKYFRQYESLFIVGGLILLVAALCALFHKCFSTDCMTHHIRRLRVSKKAKDLIIIAHKKNIDHRTTPKKLYDEEELRKLDDEDLNDDQLLSKIISCTEIVENENNSYEKDQKRCKWLLLGAVIFLIAGVSLTLSGLAQFIFNSNLNISREHIAPHKHSLFPYHYACSSIFH